MIIKLESQVEAGGKEKKKLEEDGYQVKQNSKNGFAFNGVGARTAKCNDELAPI